MPVLTAPEWLAEVDEGSRFFVSVCRGFAPQLQPRAGMCGAMAGCHLRVTPERQKPSFLPKPERLHEQVFARLQAMH